MALTGDVKTFRYGVPGNSTQPQNFGVTANVTVYRGSIAATRSGFLANMSSPQSGDVVWGLIDKYGPGFADTGPGIVGGSTNGGVTAEVATGSFFLSAGTGADALVAANVGATVFVINETTVGLTNGGNTRPVGGIFEGLASVLAPNRPDLAGLVAIKVGNASGTTGGPS